MAIGVEQDIVRLDVSVDDILAVNIAQGTAQLGDPEADGLFCERFSRDMESEITAAHKVDNEVPFQEGVSKRMVSRSYRMSYMYSMS